MKIRYWLLILIVFSSTVFAQRQKKHDQIGVGVQLSLPIIGLSGIYKVTPQIGVQGIIGLVSALKFYGVKGNYYFKTRMIYKPYVFGMFGSATYTLGNSSDSVGAYGLGGGVEYISNNIGYGVEFGYGSFDFESLDTSVSSFIVGVGLHYYLQ
ncbi:MAG: porin family protein [Melioribacteraceae bacterium]|nr:porin family protein [Melioribacteraceae bacterium]